MRSSSSAGAEPESMKPGEMALTVIPSGPSSLARVRVKIRSPDFAM